MILGDLHGLVVTVALELNRAGDVTVEVHQVKAVSKHIHPRGGEDVPPARGALDGRA